MASVAITEAELLEALADAAPGRGPADARTLREIMDATGLSKMRVSRALEVFQRSGRLTVHRVTRTAIDGRAAMVPAYTIAPVTSKKRRAV